MGGADRSGNWDGDRPIKSLTLMGGQTIDLSALEADHVTITAFTLMGGTEIIVPTGARVDVGGFMLFGGIDGNTGPGDKNGMVVQVRAWGGMGACEVRHLTEKEREKRRLAP